MSDSDVNSFKTEYAASGRSMCVKCKNTIAEGALRVGPMVQSAKGDFKYPMWHHMKCFEEGYMRRNAHVLTDVAQLSGIDRLRFEDQQKLKSLVVAADSKIAAKAVTVEEKQLAAQSKALWSFREHLDSLSTGELTQLLEANGQPHEGKIFGGRGKILDRVADGMMFGALPKCTACKGGDLYCSHGVYKCTGNVDAFARCEWKGGEDDIDRAEWKVPKGLASEHEFLGKYKFKPREKAAAITGVAAVAVAAAAPAPVAAAAVATKSKASGTRRLRDTADDAAGPDAPAATTGAAAAPLTGIAVTCCGKLSKSQKDLEDVITKLGGTFVKTAAAATVCVMTQAEADGNGTKKGQEAVASKILCVSEDWLDEIATAGCLVKAGANVLANADKRKPIVRKSGDEVKSDALKKSAAAALTAKSADSTKKFVVKGGSAVDPDSGLDKKGRIYKSPTGEVFNSMMNNTDVTTGANSFYILQLIQHEDVANRFSVFRKWGRLGSDIGDNKTTQYASAESARAEFAKVFLDKTGNSWSDFCQKKFQKRAGKFMPVETDFGGGDGGDGAQQVHQGDYRGKLDRSTQNLIAMLFDVKQMTETLKEMEINTDKMPLGRLSKNTIAEGFKCLSEAQALLQDPKYTTSADAAWRPKFVSVTNRFYNYIPHVVPVNGTLALLDSIEILQQKNDLLRTLQDMEVASKLVSSDATSADGNAPQHPIDVHYAKLKTNLTTVEKGSEEFNRIKAYIANTHGTTHTSYDLELVDLWTVDREGEAARFKLWETTPNHQLLWHGSRITNWCGILSQGLRIAPPEAPTTGYMFGKGVYFADCVSKSANYCSTSAAAPRAVMMLGQVALGDMKEFNRANYVDRLDKPFASTKGVGRNEPDARGEYFENNGCKIPMGKVGGSKHHMAAQSSLLYNEYIVYKVEQIRMRYVMRVDFKYKHTGGFGW